MTKVTVNGIDFSDDGSSSNDMQYGGFQEHMLPFVRETMIDTAGKVAAAAHQFDLANAAAASAALSASTAVTGPGSSGTSTTTLAMAMGTQSLSIQTGKTLSPGMPIVIADTTQPRNWMSGTLISYNSSTGAMVAYVTNMGFFAPGVPITASAWTISLSGVAANTGVLNEQKGADIASAATIDLTAATGNYVHVTGSVQISAITIPVGAERAVVFDGAPPLIHGAGLLLPGEANIYAAPNDRMTVRGDSAGAIVVNFTRSSGRPVRAAGAVRTMQVQASSGSYVALADGTLRITLIGAHGSGGVALNGSGGAAAASGASAGGVCVKTLPVKAGDIFISTLAAGGAMNTTTATGTAQAGNAAGNSTVTGPATNMAANGGRGGNAVIGATSAAADGVAGGTATGGDFNATGGGSGTATASGTSTAAATGGGAVSWGGAVRSSGAASAQAANSCAASGGAGVGGNSGSATTTVGTTSASGGGGSNGASDNAANNNSSGGIGMPPGCTSIPLTLAGQGGIGSSTGGGATVGGDGAGGGANAVNGNQSVGKSGGSLAGGGAAVLIGGSTMEARADNSAGTNVYAMSAATGGAAAIGSSSQATSYKGGDARVIFEWTEA